MPRTLRAARPSQPQPQPEGWLMDDAGSAVSAVDGCWVPLGQPVVLDGVTIVGGGLYVGEGLEPLVGSARARPQACLVRPSLPVDWSNPDDLGDQVGFWPSYSDLSPRSRAGYLRWVSSGCEHRHAPIAFVFLYFYGLERRLLQLHSSRHRRRGPHDVPLAMPQPPGLAGDDGADLVAEVHRLLEVYGEHPAVRRYLRDLLEAVGGTRSAGVLTPSSADSGTKTARRSRSLDLELRLALGRFANQSQPLPADNALAWWTADLASPQRSTLQRCPEEFTELFRGLYRDAHGDGLLIRGAVRPLTRFYRAASPDLPAGFTVITDAADVTTLHEPLRLIGAVVDVTDRQLRPYARHIRNDPSSAGTASAVALLPDRVLAARPADSVPLLAVAEAVLDGGSAATMTITDLHTAWGSRTWDLTQMRRARTVLARADVGLEPDPDFGGVLPSRPGRVTLFRRRGDTSPVPTQAPAAVEGPADRPSGPYLQAVLLLQALTEVTGSDRGLNDLDLIDLPARILRAFPLSNTERTRLHRHMAWLNAEPLPPVVLHQRLRALAVEQRQVLAGHLAQAFPLITANPGQAGALLDVLEQLGAQGARHRQGLLATLSAIAGDPRPGSDDPLARAELPGSPGPVFGLPPRGAPRTAGVNGPVVLDIDLLDQVRRDTVTVSRLLMDLFADADADADANVDTGGAARLDSDGPDIVPPPTPTGPGTPGTQGSFRREPGHHRPADPGALQDALTWLLTCLQDRDRIGQREWGELCAVHGLLPAATVEALNEAALDLVGDLLCRGTDPVLIDPDVLKEML